MHVTDPTQPTIVGHYIQPPFSVLDRRRGDWQKRTRWWRDQLPDDAISRSVTSMPAAGIMSTGDGISRFDPTLAEVFYRWWTAPDDLVWDPFCGGPTRGLVATRMGRHYQGIDIRTEQVEANNAHGDHWASGDARDTEPPRCDAVFTCPPYGDLERYSDDARDLSTMDWPHFAEAFDASIGHAIASLRDDRYIGIVISDVRDQSGAYRGLPSLVSSTMRNRGVSIVADAVVVDPVGKKYLVGWKLLGQSRKLQRTHQHLIVGCKGDIRRAARRLASEKMHETPVGE